MMENKEQFFKEELDYLVESYGVENDEGIKEALRTCQDTFGSVSKAHQIQITDTFQVEDKKVKTLMKFMPSIKESGEEIEIICCTGPRCSKNGSYEVIKLVKKSLGIDFNEVTDDGKIRLRSQNCFRKCQHGPNLQVNGKFYHGMNHEKTRELMVQLKD